MSLATWIYYWHSSVLQSLLDLYLAAEPDHYGLEDVVQAAEEEEESQDQKRQLEQRKVAAVSEGE